MIFIVYALQVYMNIIALLEEVLPLQCEDQLRAHVSRLCWFFIRCSSEQPLVSAHYTSLTTILVCAQKIYYFEKTKVFIFNGCLQNLGLIPACLFSFGRSLDE